VRASWMIFARLSLTSIAGSLTPASFMPAERAVCAVQRAMLCDCVVRGDNHRDHVTLHGFCFATLDAPPSYSITFSNQHSRTFDTKQTTRHVFTACFKPAAAFHTPAPRTSPT
jgi:hypothetical protein